MNCSISIWSRTIRSPIAVSASACVFILVGSIERFIVLDGVEDITERLKSVDELQRRLDESEGCLHALRTVPVNNFSNGGDIGFFNGERHGHWA